MFEICSGFKSQQSPITFVLQIPAFLKFLMRVFHMTFRRIRHPHVFFVGLVDNNKMVVIPENDSGKRHFKHQITNIAFQGQRMQPNTFRTMTDI